LPPRSLQLVFLFCDHSRGASSFFQALFPASFPGFAFGSFFLFLFARFRPTPPFGDDLGPSSFFSFLIISFFERRHAEVFPRFLRDHRPPPSLLFPSSLFFPPFSGTNGPSFAAHGSLLQTRDGRKTFFLLSSYNFHSCASTSLLL